MTRSELVKTRLTPRTKTAFVRFADNMDTTVSDLMRDLIHQTMTGRSVDRDVRTDMVAIRQLANVVLSSAGDPAKVDVLVDAGKRLRALTERHLEPVT